MNFAVSTTAFRRKPIEWVLDQARQAGLQLEFSSGLPYREDMESIFLAATGVRRLPHNYFPAPKIPFVLNLGSMDPEIRSKSIDHARHGLRLAARSGAPFYSAHAGFCIDPKPQDLGHELDLTQRHSRDEHWKSFVGAVRELAIEASRLGVKMLVENNVVAPFNVAKDGTAPLLCAHFDEVERLAREVSSDGLGMLLDTGHLKVSAEALGFSRDEYMKRVGHLIEAVHHSDNDGKTDSNEALTGDYWFLPYMKNYPHAWHILEVHDQTLEQIEAQRELLSKAGAA
ncbi:MAG: TIM barrel protein [Deltaproteobacteria bacterium]|nr:TIM barrel protein [Deltaproteobacteria bacterium]